MATKKKADVDEAKGAEVTPQPVEETPVDLSNNENDTQDEQQPLPVDDPTPETDNQPIPEECVDSDTNEHPVVDQTGNPEPVGEGELDSETEETPEANEQPTADQEEEILPEETAKPMVAIVIPYLKKKAQGNELLYAIRSIAKHFEQDDYMIVVIGDKEDWFGDDILHIDHTCIGDNPQADVIDKMKHILADERIPEGFVWSNDDIYFVKPTTLTDIQVLKVAGNLIDDGSTSLYNRNRIRTINLLKKHGCPTKNFATHMPVFFLKEKMVEVFEGIPEMSSQGLLMSSLYFNLQFPKAPVVTHDWKKDKWALRVVSKLATEEKKQAFRQLIKSKHFLNHSEAGYSALLMDWVARQFPEKSRFEK